MLARGRVGALPELPPRPVASETLDATKELHVDCGRLTEVPEPYFFEQRAIALANVVAAPDGVNL